MPVHNTIDTSVITIKRVSNILLHVASAVYYQDFGGFEHFHRNYF